MAITRWQPLRELTELRDKMNKLFEDFSGEREKTEEPSTGWSPPIDIYEEEDQIVLMADLPGTDKKDISLDLEGNRLTIRGERRLEQEVKEENYHRIERSYGSFARSFSLPDTVDVENIKATFENGELEVRIPKKTEGASSRRIDIEIE